MKRITLVLAISLVAGMATAGAAMADFNDCVAAAIAVFHSCEDFCNALSYPTPEGCIEQCWEEYNSNYFVCYLVHIGFPPV